jgi:hypothetical protein
MGEWRRRRYIGRDFTDPVSFILITIMDEDNGNKNTRTNRTNNTITMIPPWGTYSVPDPLCE